MSFSSSSDPRTAPQSLLPVGWVPVEPPPDLEDVATPALVSLRVAGNDGTPGLLYTVAGPVAGSVRRRLRSEQPDLDAVLRAATADPTGAALLPWIEYGDPRSSRPYLVCVRTGTPLYDDLLRGPLPADRVVAVALTCIEALHALHRQQRHHGLLAPQSLLHDGEHGVRLVPPLPPALAELVALTGGTGHEPPEVLRGGVPTAAADVFSLASTAWTLLSGRPPFGPAGDHLARLTAAEPPPLQRADVPSAMEAALRAALSPEPSRRPDLATLAQALRIVSPAGPAADPQVTTGGEQLRQDTLAPTRPVADAGRPLGSRYLLDALIGRGATGHVWRGHVRDSGRPVAVKLLRSELAEDPEVVTRFMRERSALMQLHHPNLVAIHDLVAEGGALAIVMDLVEGKDLRTVLASGPLPPREAGRLLAGTAAALAAVHAGGFVHRDLKPENVIVEGAAGDGRARLTDFGLARAVESSAITRITQLVGTPAYVAPEVVAGRPPGPPVDVYAFGITAYEVLVGRRPFAGTSTAALLRAHLDEPPPRPEELPDDLWHLIDACLAKDPAARPTAGALAAAWSDVAEGRQASVPALPAAVPSGALDTPLRSSGRHVDPMPAPPELLSSTGFPAGVQPTTGAERPLAARPPAPPAAPRSRKKLWWALAAVVVLGFGGGFGYAALRGDDKPKPAAQQDPGYPLDASIQITKVDGDSFPEVRWQVPPGITTQKSYIIVFSYSTATKRLSVLQSGSGLRTDRHNFYAPTLRAGDCAVVLLYGTTKPPPAGHTKPTPACLPKAKATPSPKPSAKSSPKPTAKPRQSSRPKPSASTRKSPSARKPPTTRRSSS